MLNMRVQKEEGRMIIFNYNCGICDKYTGADGSFKRFPVRYKVTGEKMLVCETCLSFIKEAGTLSSFEVI
jgi:hypothetical protein